VLLQQLGPLSLVSSCNNRKVLFSRKFSSPPFFLGLVLFCFFFFFFFSPPPPPHFWGKMLGLLLPRGFGCSLFLNGSLFASFVISKYPLSSLF
jgi:hypothetical protein